MVHVTGEADMHDHQCWMARVTGKACDSCAYLVAEITQNFDLPGLNVGRYVGATFKDDVEEQCSCCSHF